MINCIKCNFPLDRNYYNTSRECLACNTLLDIEVFPAFFKKPEETDTGTTLLVPDEAGCFYHPQKKALLPCDVCGRFICGLCEVELNEQHLCPQCLSSGQKKKKLKNVDNQRILYDNAALFLAIVPMLFFYVVIITAPIALFMSIHYWKAPLSVIPRTRIRFVFAILISILQIVGIVVFAYFMITKFKAF